MTDTLPPGATPAWADSDPAADIALIWQQEMWPVLSQRIIYSYATSVARDADIPSGAPAERFWAFVEDSKTLWRWNGTAWALATPWQQSSTSAFTVNATSDTVTRTASIAFPVAFPSVPIVECQSLTGATSPSTTWSVWPSSITTSGFQLNGLRNNTTAMTVRWTATLLP